MIRQAADVAGMTVSHFMVVSAREKAEQILVDRAFHLLDEGAWAIGDGVHDVVREGGVGERVAGTTCGLDEDPHQSVTRWIAEQDERR